MGILARLTRPDVGDPPTTEATDVALAPSGDATRLRRRGLIAGAAALAAATLAAHPDPVAAAPLAGTANGYTGGTDANQDGVQGYAAGAGNAGVFGRNNDLNGVGVSGAAPSGIGVSGSSGSGPGVSGTSTSGPGTYGTSPSSIGAYGTSDSSYGVGGGSTSGHGVAGFSTSGHGVLGQSTSGYGVAASTTGAGKAAYYGVGSGAGTKAAELHGDVDIWGVTRGTTTAGHAVIGATSQASCGGVLGIANAASTIGVIGSNNNIASAYAAQFFGAVLVVGNFAVTGTKNAAVPFPDGSQRLMYSVEAPEAWFEDFGEAALTNGRAVVRLDPDFAQTILVDNYHVFLTPYGDASLFVSARTPTGFTVQERGGASGVTFSWRVVAKRKDVESPRLAQVVAPSVLAPPPAGTAPKVPDDLAMPRPLPDTGRMMAPKPFAVTAPTAMPLAGPTLTGPMFAPAGSAPARAMPGVGTMGTAAPTSAPMPTPTTSAPTATPTASATATATGTPAATSAPTATATSVPTATRPPATAPALAPAPAAVIPATTPALTATPRPTSTATPGATSTSTPAAPPRATGTTAGATAASTTGTTTPGATTAGTGTATSTPASAPPPR